VLSVLRLFIVVWHLEFGLFKLGFLSYTAFWQNSIWTFFVFVLFIVVWGFEFGLLKLGF
jgi:hypothetical protein